MDLLQAIILGVVEGVTEFLPISSTAHLVITADILKLSQSDFTKTFEIAIQSGAILSVVVLYFRKFLDIEVLKRIITAFIPTATIGLVFYKLIKTYLIGDSAVMLWALGLGGVFLVLFEIFFKDKNSVDGVTNISYRQSFLIGLFQSVAMIPGVSRAAATIVGGMMLGVRRETIVEFSFLLAVPQMLAATALDLLKSFGDFSSGQFSVLGVGLVVSFLTAIVSIKFLLAFIKTRTFVAFGVYRIILVLALLLLWH